MNSVHPLQTEVVVDGRKWYLFDANYETPDGNFSFHFYALDRGHAAMILADIKETATLGGQILGFSPA